MQTSLIDRTDTETVEFETILQRGVRLNIVIMGLLFGVTGGLVLFFATQLSLAFTGEDAGRYLNLLGVFLPGYSASPTGAWIGLFWGLLVGGFSGGFVYWIYARNIDRRFVEVTDRGASSERVTMRLSSKSLGIAFGLLAALQLFLTTMWLVVRGTADESTHAALLRNYLPGYEVSFLGALYGCIELFVFVFVAAAIFAGVYNFVALRGQGPRK